MLVSVALTCCSAFMQSHFHDWADARVFLAVARKGSTLAASRELAMTQTTVARRIDALEHKLGIILFDRNTRGFHLTEDGQTLIHAAEAMETASMEFEKAAKAVRDAQSGPIRFTAWDSSINTDLSTVFADFSTANPGTTFEFLTTEKPIDLSAGDADVALRLAGQNLDDSLIGRRIGETHWTYFASKTYVETHGAPESFEGDMEDHTVVLLRHITTKRKNVLFCDSAADILMALRTGRGIGPLPVIQGDRENTLIRCFPPPPEAELQVWLLASPTAYRRLEVQRFMAFAGPRFADYFKRES